MLHHLKVGDKTHEPTADDLEQVVAEYKKSCPVFSTKVVVTALESVFETDRLLVTLPGGTPEEIGTLRTQFVDAIAEAHSTGCAIIATSWRVSTAYAPRLDPVPTEIK